MSHLNGKAIIKKKMHLILQVKSSALCSLLVSSELQHNRNKEFPSGELSIPQTKEERGQMRMVRPVKSQRKVDQIVTHIATMLDKKAF